MISVAICAHNSADRLPETLRHLATQREAGCRWEVVVIDNASTDGTAEAARRLWPADAPAPLRVFLEPRKGLTHARERAFAEANGEVLVFVDDDNWLAPDYLARVARTFGDDPTLAALGGRVEGVFETTPGPMLLPHLRHLAVGGSEGKIDDKTGRVMWLWGAGLCLSVPAVRKLKTAGFRSVLVGRKGNSLLSGEDSELCLALVAAQFRLCYDDALRLRHFMPRWRTETDYLTKVYRGHERSNVILGYYWSWCYGGGPVDRLPSLARIVVREVRNHLHARSCSVNGSNKLEAQLAWSGLLGRLQGQRDLRKMRPGLNANYAAIQSLVNGR